MLNSPGNSTPTQSPFDDCAETYDRDFSDTLIGTVQRNLILECVFKHLQQTDRVLEVNCGTGVDALRLATACSFVLATDVSQEMIKKAREKLAFSKRTHVRFEVMDIRDLSSRHSEKYNFLFSNFAGLNCLNRVDLDVFARNAKSSLHPDGLLILVFLGKKCWQEKLYFMLKRDERKNRRLQPEGSDVKLLSQSVRTYFYSKEEICDVFHTFEFIESFPVGLIVPPAFMEKRHKRHKWLMPFLVWVEKKLRFSSLSDYGDHFLIVLRNRSIQ